MMQYLDVVAAAEAGIRPLPEDVMEPTFTVLSYRCPSPDGYESGSGIPIRFACAILWIYGVTYPGATLRSVRV